MRNFLKIVFGLLITVSIIVLATILFESFLTETDIDVKVLKKEKVVKEDNSILYLIYTDKEVFRDENNKYHGKDNAELLYKKLRKGKRYTFSVVGFSFRKYLPYLSKYRNVIDIVNKKDKTRNVKEY